jgi:hypothetical protein
MSPDDLLGNSHVTAPGDQLPAVSATNLPVIESTREGSFVLPPRCEEPTVRAEHYAAAKVNVAVSCQLWVFVFVPSDSTFRCHITPEVLALKVPHSAHAKFASDVP